MCWNSELLMEYCTFAILILQICVLRLKNVLKSFILVIIIHLLTLFIIIWNMLILQLKLLSNGFRLLKVRGSLVYSTCRCLSLIVSMALKQPGLPLFWLIPFLLVWLSLKMKMWYRSFSRKMLLQVGSLCFEFFNLK